ncbi:MAG: RT0821/Lpp0805 family surface protein [Kiloniellales bacterium]|nr:RT0821/Lpp0805 family surface protein [Kiloniellales bacterium]
MKLKTLVAVIAIALTVAACAGRGPKQTVGTVGGAAVGGLIGSQIGSGTGRLIATGAGVFLGGLIGSEIGRSMDEVDQIKNDRAVQTATRAPIGETITWNNPDSGNSGAVTPTRDGTASTGEYCREFQQTVTIGGKTEEAYGIACRKPDGSWEVRQ